MIFHIDDEKYLACDLDELIGTRMLVQANSGGGKSWLLRRILEQTHGHVQQIVIDPEGEFASLRERYDYVHASPSGGDTVAHPRSAALLAEKLLELRVSAILDIYELHPHERVRFVKIFLEALVNLPKRLWHETLVVVDEAHAFAPEKGSAESLSAMIGLASLGRKRGFAALYATQRIQKLHKDAAADLNNKLIGRTSLDIDIARAGDELGFDKLKRRELPHLAPGQFFATGPAFNQRGVVEVYVGKVRTTHPKAGKRIAFTAPPPTAKIKALLPQLSDLPAEAEKKAKTESNLRAEVSMLRRELAARPSVEPKTIEVSVLTDEDRTAIGGLSFAMNKAHGELEILHKTIAARRSPPPPPREYPRAPVPPPQKPRVLGESQSRIVAAGSMPKGQRAILTVLAQSPEGSTKSRLALLSGYAPSGGGFNNYLATLRTTGAIEGSDPIRITATGLEGLGAVEELPKGEALVEYWLAKLGKAERAILTYLVQCFPNAMPKETVAKAAGYEPHGGGFNNALSHLRTIELIEGRGELRAAAALTE
jgi:hypothetical protein